MIDFHVAAVRPQAPLQSAFFHEWVFPDGTLWTQFCRTKAGYLLRFPDLADFEVSADGHVVCCWPVPGISESSVQRLARAQPPRIAPLKTDSVRHGPRRPVV